MREQQDLPYEINELNEKSRLEKITNSIRFSPRKAPYCLAIVHAGISTAPAPLEPEFILNAAAPDVGTNTQL